MYTFIQMFLRMAIMLALISEYNILSYSKINNVTVGIFCIKFNSISYDAMVL